MPHIMHAVIIDMDATYGVYALAGDTTWNEITNNDNNNQGANNNTNHSHKYDQCFLAGPCWFAMGFNVGPMETQSC